MEKSQLLKQVKQAIIEVEPEATVILYGSRSRGDAVPESDWDFFVLINGQINEHRINGIRHKVYEIEWECGEVLSTIIRSFEQWNSPLYKTMPFHDIIEQEGTVL